MKNRFALPLAALALSLPITDAIAAPPTAADENRSRPMQAALNDATPLPADTPWPGGTIDLNIDASDTVRGLYKVTETIPVAPGTSELTLLFPKFIPGKHAARGPINLLADVRFFADGKPLAWMRDPLDVYAFRLSLPAGTKAVTAKFVHTSPLESKEGRISMTQEMFNLQWDMMSLYPAGHYIRRIAFNPTVTVPAGWTVYTALDGKSRSGDTVRWGTVDYETLVDSPIFAGKYAKSWEMGKDTRLDVVADDPKYLELAPQNLQSFKNMFTQADYLFGARHFDHYTTLLALTDRMGGIGLEHHRSSENQYEPTAFIDWDDMDWDHNVVAHELVHSWNGKYRRPADLWTPDFRTPMQNSLLWVYEGQTQFWGWVLAARSGVQTKETVLGQFARAAAFYSEGQPGREWRSVADTTNDPIINARRPLPYPSLNRSEDYYTEGALVWLEADQIIRAGTKGKKGLDDFARRFFGQNDGDWGVSTYTFDDVVADLNAIYPYDWAQFLTTRMLTPGQPAPVKGIEMAGYKLVFRDKPNSYEGGRMASNKSLDLTYSLGMTLDKDGDVTATLWNGPGFKAGIVDGARILAVNSIEYSADAMRDAIKAAAKGKEPIQLLVKRGENVTTVPVDYHGGLRYPWLTPVKPGEQGLDHLLTPRTGK